MSRTPLKKIVVAGLGGDSGKSLVTLGLIGALRRRGLTVAPFKKGPDFIDAAWLGRAAGREGRNLDTYLMPADAIVQSVAASNADIAVIEGNRGLFDGMTAKGEHSTAALARLIDAPVILVVDTTKVTRTVAAIVKGCAEFEPGLRLGGVVLNQVATKRQERIIKEAVEEETGVPVLGVVYRRRKPLLPSRHLGLLTATEHPDVETALDTAIKMVDGPVDVDRVLGVAQCQLDNHGEGAPPLKKGEQEEADKPKIAILKDKAFSFYYPENLEALVYAGAELIYLSPLVDDTLPDDIDGVYIGGGFPEVYARELASNEAFRFSLRDRIEAGLPVFAECGGLMYLARSLSVDAVAYPMVGALPVDVAKRSRPMGHGYVTGCIDGQTPFFSENVVFRGHEFHYSQIVSDTSDLRTVASLEKGVGIGGKRDGIAEGNVLAFYTHFHALGTPTWATGFLSAVSRGGNVR